MSEQAIELVAAAMPKSNITETDVYTLVGHAEFLRRVRGEHDMPDYFFGLAERLCVLLGDQELARRCAEMRAASAIRDSAG
jgi:hypothetical protein